MWLGLRLGVFTCIGWKVTLCDLIRQVTPCTSEIEFHLQLHMTFSHLNFNQTDEKHYRRHSLKTFQFLPVFLCVFFVTIWVLNLLENIVQCGPMYSCKWTITQPILSCTRAQLQQWSEISKSPHGLRTCGSHYFMQCMWPLTMVGMVRVMWPHTFFDVKC